VSKEVTIGKDDAGHAVHLDVARLVKTRLLVTANSGGGKSWLLRLLFEQLGKSTQIIVLDREGEFVTLREVLDLLIVGPEGEIPADVRSAPLLVRRLMEKEISAVIDMSEMKLPQQRAYVRTFLDSMLELKKDLWHPCIVGLDETHLFAPEKGQSEAADSVIGLATLGRKRGFCAVYATQRISKLHKDAAAELLNKFIGRTTLDIDQDRAADELGMNRKDARPVLRDLSPIGAEGEFFGFGPAMSGAGVRKMRVGKVQTTHPEAGRGRTLTPPKPSSTITALLPELKDLPQQAQAEAKDIGEARARIRELERAVKTATSGTADPAAVADLRKAVAGRDAVIKQLRKGLEDAMKVVAQIEAKGFEKTAVDPNQVRKAVEAATDQIVRLVEQTIGRREAEVAALKKEAKALLDRLGKLLEQDVNVKVEVRHNEPFTVSQPHPSRPPRATRQPPADGTPGELTEMKRRMLTALAQHPEGLTKAQILIHSRYSSNGSTSAAFADLVRDGWADVPAPSSLRITDAGAAALGPYDPLPSGAQLRQLRLEDPNYSVMEKKILSALFDAYPNPIAKGELLEKVGYSSNGSTSAVFAKLVKLGWAKSAGAGQLKASDDFFTE
jgi:hypothetical protein